MLDDKYRIEHLLATGGMGAVYVGTHLGLRKRVAIKVLNPQLSTAPMVERFHREAITASQIGHEGIVQVTDLGTSLDGEPFLVMEYLEGESLTRRLADRGRLAVAEACELGCSILSPLAAAHRAGIIHRDLKPDNVFLARQSRGEMVKLLDFGISRTAGTDPTFRLTMTGLVLGTPYYMSPEQARGESEITPAADLYAFGVMLYEMLIGDVPIRAENYNALMYRVTMGDFARPRELRPDLPRQLERLILQAMAQSPADRPASAESFERALLAFCRPVFREHATGGTAPGVALKALLGERARDAVDPTGFAGPTISDGGPRAPSPSPSPSPWPTGDTLQDPVLSALTAYDEIDELVETSSCDAPGGRDALDGRDTLGDRDPPGGRDTRDDRDPPGSRHALDDREVARDACARLRGLPLALDPASHAVRQAAVTVREAPRASGPPRHRRTARRLIGLAIVAASAVAAGSLIVALADHGGGPPPAAPASAPAVASPPVATAPVRAPAPGEAPAARDATTITLRFAVAPPDAVIMVDGTRLQATDLAVARDTAPHRLRITAAGYASHEDLIAFDESQRLVIQLKRADRPGSKGARIERTRLERTGRIDGTSRSDGSGRGDGSDRTEQPDRADRIEKDSPYR